MKNKICTENFMRNTFNASTSRDYNIQNENSLKISLIAREYI